MKVYIETLGCPKNIWDSNVGAVILKRANYEIVDELDQADIVIVNTCGFINDAKEESIDTILDLAEAKKEDAILLVSGCLSERYREELFNEMKEIDILTGVNDYGKLPELISQYKDKGRFFSFSESGEELRDSVKSYSHSAYLKIAEGCDSFCSYCIIPFIRGKYKSRKMEDIINDAKTMVQEGVVEIILIAQDLSYYGMDLYGERSLAKLLKEMCEIEGIKWIRLMYCYEDGITDELIHVMAENKEICSYIDIPIQHSENTVLENMNRNSTKESILSTIKRLRTAIPDIHIRTTLLSGFPGESDVDAKALEDFIKEVKFERLGVFAFSKEEGTPAYDMEGQIPRDIIETRRDRLMSIQKEISLKINEAKEGKIFEVLLEEKDGDVYLGRTCYDAPEIDNMVIFTSSFNPKIGEFVYVKIDEAWDYDIFGKQVKMPKGDGYEPAK